MDKVKLSSAYGKMRMDREELIEYLEQLERYLSIPIVYQDPKTGFYCVRAGGTKQAVYERFCKARHSITYVLRSIKESEDGIK